VWNDPLSQTTAKIANLNAGIYRVVAKDTFGCEDSMTTSVIAYKKVYDALNDTLIYRGTAIQLRLKNALPSKWYGPKILGKDSGMRILVRPLKDTLYTVSGVDINGCFGRDTVSVLVTDPPTLRIPNIITPNGDRKNDVWDLIELGELEMYDITISDRYGKRVFFTDNYQNNWNAVDSDGNELPNGQYLFKLKHRQNYNVIQGYLQVIR
jgi:gliding motility-associated-like protein